MDGIAKGARTTTLPEGYEDETTFLSDVRARFEEGLNADRENRDMALDDLKFLSGEQWDETVRRARLKKGRPCLTINNLPQFVGQVIGDTRSNRPSIKVRPAEDGDKKIAEIRQGLIRFIENTSNASQVYAMAGEDQVSCGLGHFRVGLVYSNDDSFDRDIRLDHIANPFSVVWDASSVEPTGADAQFCFVVDELPRKTFEEAYPDVTPSDLTVPLPQQGWVSTDTVRVTEYWVMKETKRRIAMVLRPPNAEPTIEDVTDNEAEMTPFIVKGASGQPQVRDKIKKSACMYLLTGVTVLEGPFEYPISRLPVFKVTGREVRVGEKRYRFGLIRFAKDAVRMKNLWRSSAAEWISMAPKQQWLLHAADREEANRYRDAGSSGDTVLTYSGQIPPQRIDPPTAPSALLQEAAINDQDIKDATGLHDASLGMKSNETSGKAILARERQGDVATFMYHDNLNAAIREAGRVINDLIPVVFDTARTITVLGEDDSSAAHRVNDPASPEGFIDLKTGKYDIVVEVGPSYSTKRVEAAESMMAFVQAVPQAAAVVGDLIAKSQDWPMANEIAERLKKTLPPGMAEEDDSELTDEQKAQKEQARQQAEQEQQQAKQMQMQGAMLELAEREAKVMLTRAQAGKMEADAGMVGAEKGPTKTPLELALLEQQVRKAAAEADEAEAKAALAQATFNANATKTQAEANKAEIGVVSDMMDLDNKPKEQALNRAAQAKQLQEQPEPAED